MSAYYTARSKKYARSRVSRHATLETSIDIERVLDVAFDFEPTALCACVHSLLGCRFERLWASRGHFWR